MYQNVPYKRVFVTIDLDAIVFNMESMKQNIKPGTEMMGVVKADGYGHGAVPVAKAMDPYVWGYAAATSEEALQLRAHGITKPVLVLSPVHPSEFQELIREGIRITVFTREQAEDISKEASALGKTANIHIAVDTGMSRIGVIPDEHSAALVEEISQMDGIRVEGLFTHFAKADEEEKESTRKQMERFTYFARLLEDRGLEIPRKHVANSAGIIDFPDLKHDIARAGISIYGMYPSDDVDQNAVSLRPALRLVSHVSFVKEVGKGTSISYGGTYITEKKMKIATIPVGYGDGYPRSLSNKGYVLIHGKKARILGRVCMDQFMVDVTEIPDVAFMDEVILIGRDQEEQIQVEDLAELSGRFNYEFVCCLSKRIPRAYLKNGKIISQTDYF